MIALNVSKSIISWFVSIIINICLVAETTINLIMQLAYPKTVIYFHYYQIIDQL